MDESPHSYQRQTGRPNAKWRRGEIPPWVREGVPPSWVREGKPPPWRHGRRRFRRALFWRFVAVFGLIVLLVAGGMALLAWLFTRWTGGGQQVAALVWVGGCGLALALPLLAALVATRAFRGIATPLADVMGAADAVAEGDLNVRVAERGSSEFRQLARSFNRMAERLQQSDQQRRTLMADVAHELRTPLHIIQGNLEGVIDGVYAPTPAHIEATLDETRLLARLVEDLRTLSLAEAGQLPMQWEAVDVAELLRDGATSFSGQAEAAGVTLAVELPSPPASLVVTADYRRLDQVIGNLIANALRHTPPGGTVTLRGQARGDSVLMEVSDTGAGIPADELPYIFDRFWSRGGEGNAGTGLGLAIARSIVVAHGGAIDAESVLGQGTTVRVTLPLRR
jgi:signal transduction histidine kinase